MQNMKPYANFAYFRAFGAIYLNTAFRQHPTVFLRNVATFLPFLTMYFTLTASSTLIRFRLNLFRVSASWSLMVIATSGPASVATTIVFVSRSTLFTGPLIFSSAAAAPARTTKDNTAGTCALKMVQLKGLGVKFEACSIGARLTRVDTASIYPEVKVVANTFISLTGYQSRGCAYIPIH